LQQPKLRLLSCAVAGFHHRPMVNSADSADWPDPRRAWFVVAVLMTAYAVSFVDRQVINLLTESLKHDLQISDLQIGMLQGLAFGVFYTLVGLPLGRLSDTLNRRNVIMTGSLVWSLMTAGCGLAGSFGQLFLARVGVGVGEAALTPAAMSMISDYFPPERRAMPMSLYVTGTSLGSGVALIIGGAVIGKVTQMGVLEVPVLGVIAPWQAVFMAVGLPSLLLVPLLSLVREPLRRGLLAGVGGAPTATIGLRDGLRFVWARRRVYLSHNLGLAAVSIFTYGLSVWGPALFMRRFGWSPQDVGLAYGLMTVISGVSGVLAGGWMAQRLRRAGRRDANWRVLTVCVMMLVPIGAIAPLLPEARMVLALYVPLTFLTTMPYGIGAAALQEITPNQLRAQVTSIYLLALGVLGLGLGPTGVGFFTDRVFHDPMAIGKSMSLLVGIIGPLAIGALIYGWRHYARLLDSEDWTR
jgi:MFS family permease